MRFHAHHHHQALFLIHRFFSVSLVLFFFLWHFSSSASAEFSLFKSKVFFIFIFNYQQFFCLNFWVNCLFFLMIRVLLLYQLNWKRVWRLMLTEPVVHILEVGMIMDGFIFLSELDCFSGYDEFESFYWF